MENGQQQPQVLETENRKVTEEVGETDPYPVGQAGASSFPTFIGKHRMQAAISQLNNQINIIQEEMEELETIGESSKVCKNVISSVESIPDPLLPLVSNQRYKLMT